MMRDHFTEEILADYHRSLLPPVLSASIAQHLSECADCRATAQSVSVLLEGFAATASGFAISESANDRVMGAIRVEAGRRQGTTIAARRRLPWRALSITRWSAVAALVLIAVGIVWLEARPTIVARLVSVSDQVTLRRNGVDRRAQAGADLRADDTLITPADGNATFILTDTTHVELGPGTTIGLTGVPAQGHAGDMRLDAGFLSIEAAHRSPDHPMRITTPDARADVLGTKFTLAATHTRTNIRVAEGRVKLTRNRDGNSVEVPGGFRSTVGDDRSLVPAASRSGSVLVIVSREKANPNWDQFNKSMGTRLVSERLRQLSLRVEIMDHRDVQISNLANRALVIVAHSEAGVGLEESLQRIGLPHASVPVICLEAIALPVLGMSGPREGSDYRFDQGRLPLELLNRSHPLADGLNITRIGKLPCYGWAVPMPSATIIARLRDEHRKSAFFAYEAGKALFTGEIAPARRVGLLLDPDRVNAEDDAGWNAFEAAVNWCADNAPASGSTDAPVSERPIGPARASLPTVSSALPIRCDAFLPPFHANEDLNCN